MLYRREKRGVMIGAQTKIASRLQKGGIRMTKYRILMADGNLQFQTAVRDCLAAQEQVAQFEAVTDGQAAIDALRRAL